MESKISGLSPFRRLVFPKKVRETRSVRKSQNYSTYYPENNAEIVAVDFANASQVQR